MPVIFLVILSAMFLTGDDDTTGQVARAKRPPVKARPVFAAPARFNFMSWHLAGLSKDRPAHMWGHPTEWGGGGRRGAHPPDPGSGSGVGAKR